MDVAVWQERWMEKKYNLSSGLKIILARLQEAGVDSNYIEWLLRPEYLKARHEGHPPSRIPEKAQQEIVDLFSELDALLKKMHEMVDAQTLPGRPVENFRRWVPTFIKDVEPACPLIAGYPAIMRKFREEKPGFFRGHPPDERVQVAFLVSEELRRKFPRRYWPTVAALIEIRFPSDRAWCTPETLSRAVGRLKARIGMKASNGVVEAYRRWFKRISRRPNPRAPGRRSV